MLLVTAGFAAMALAGVDEATAGRVLLALQQARTSAGAEDLLRRADLDALAQQRARAVGELPHSDRLAFGRSIESELEGAGVTQYRRASSHLDMVRGYPVASDGAADASALGGRRFRGAYR